MSDKRQNNQLVLAFAEMSRSEAPRDSGEGTEALMAKREAESMVSSEHRMEEVCELKNCEQALARVKSNKGSAGIDGMTVEQLPGYLKQHWPTIRGQLLTPILRRNLVKRRFKPALTKAELPLNHSLYALRHTCASLLLQAGTHPKVVAERLGHSSTTLTMDVYSHVAPGMPSEATEQLEIMFYVRKDCCPSFEVGTL